MRSRKLLAAGWRCSRCGAAGAASPPTCRCRRAGHRVAEPDAFGGWYLRGDVGCGMRRRSGATCELGAQASTDHGFARNAQHRQRRASSEPASATSSTAGSAPTSRASIAASEVSARYRRAIPTRSASAASTALDAASLLQQSRRWAVHGQRLFRSRHLEPASRPIVGAGLGTGYTSGALYRLRPRTLRQPARHHRARGRVGPRLGAHGRRRRYQVAPSLTWRSATAISTSARWTRRRSSAAAPAPAPTRSSESRSRRTTSASACAGCSACRSPPTSLRPRSSGSTEHGSTHFRRRAQARLRGHVPGTFRGSYRFPADLGSMHACSARC